MGGRGVYSFGGNSGSVSNGQPLKAYAVAALNSGTAGGTSVESAIERFREQTVSEKYEYSAYIDSAGYIHSLASESSEDGTRLAPLGTVSKEVGIIAVTHNHPSAAGTSRKWGGPLSDDDYYALYNTYRQSGGNVTRMVATAREGTYQARIMKPVTRKQISNAIKNATGTLKGSKRQSEWAMWKAVHDTYSKEFAKIGIEVQFAKQRKAKGKLVTQQIGVY